MKVITVDTSGSFIPLLKIFFPNAKIGLNRFYIVQHLSLTLNQILVQLMKQFDDNVLEHDALKYHWKLVLKDSYNLSPDSFYSKTLEETLTPKECLSKIVQLVPDLKSYYVLYQFLLFHLQEKNFKHFFDLIEESLPLLNKLLKQLLEYLFDTKTMSQILFNYLILMKNLRQATSLSKLSNETHLESKTLKTLKHEFLSLLTCKKRKYILSPFVLSYRSPNAVEKETK